MQPDESEVIIKEASQLMGKGEFRKAEEMLSALQKDRPLDEMVMFLLGRLYLKEGQEDKAEPLLKQTAGTYHLLNDYAHILLAEIYLDQNEHEKAVSEAGAIKRPFLKKESMLIKVEALQAMKMDGGLRDALSVLTSSYPYEWDYKWMLASLLRNEGDLSGAVGIYRNLLISASPRYLEARKELKMLRADILMKRERLKLADNLYRQGKYREAELHYRKVVTGFIDPLRKRIRHRMAMCRFRLKDYKRSAGLFGMIDLPMARYWQARSYYRADDFSGFMQALNLLEERYPKDRHYAKTLFIYADDLRRKGDVKAATDIFTKISKGFPESAEAALWGIAWMNYSAGNLEAAIEALTELSGYKGSRDYNKYLYWKAKSIEKMNASCKYPSGEETGEACSKAGDALPDDINVDQSYYGFLLNFRYGAGVLPGRVESSLPERPGGESFERIDALALLGMKDEAIEEIRSVLVRTARSDERLYLGYLANELNEYKSVIRFAERAEGGEFLALSYPFAYRSLITSSSGSKGIDPYLVLALMREESRFDPEALSWAGAYGLMQLMPATANRMKKKAGVELKGRSDLHDAEKNILIGTEYLSLVLGEFGELPFSIASYNAGENAVKGWMERFEGMEMDEIIEDIPYLETRRYVKRVLKSYWQYRVIYGLDVKGY